MNWVLMKSLIELSFQLTLNSATDETVSPQLLRYYRSHGTFVIPPKIVKLDTLSQAKCTNIDSVQSSLYNQSTFSVLNKQMGYCGLHLLPPIRHQATECCLQYSFMEIHTKLCFEIIFI